MEYPVCSHNAGDTAAHDCLFYLTETDYIWDAERIGERVVFGNQET